MLISACSGTGVVATSDPDRKLAQAQELQSSGRIAQSRQLVLEAAELYEAEGDQRGLAAAYRQMGFLIKIYGEDTILASSAPAQSKMDTATADSSIAYFERALAIQQQIGDHDMVSHLRFNIGANYAVSGRVPEACEAFERSRAAYQAEKRQRPEHDPVLPEGIESFDAFIDQAKEEAGCA